MKSYLYKLLIVFHQKHFEIAISGANEKSQKIFFLSILP